MIIVNRRFKIKMTLYRARQWVEQLRGRLTGASGSADLESEIDRVKTQLDNLVDHALNKMILSFKYNAGSEFVAIEIKICDLERRVLAIKDEKLQSLLKKVRAKSSLLNKALVTVHELSVNLANKEKRND